MSIIQEALKKAQNYIENQKPVQKIEPENALPRPEILSSTKTIPKAKEKDLKGPLLLILLFVFAAFLAKQFLMGDLFKAKKPAKDAAAITTSHQDITYKPLAAITPKAEALPNAPVTAPLVNPAEAKRPILILNGIMYLNDGAQAIINNSVVMEGDTIDGAKVMRINRNNVILNFNNLEITLSLKK